MMWALCILFLCGIALFALGHVECKEGSPLWLLGEVLGWTAAWILVCIVFLLIMTA